MIKFYNAMVVFEEIPDEITIAINITNCPCKCDGCHSKFLWNDIGHELNENKLDELITDNFGITCVCFMGGDADQEGIDGLANYTKEVLKLKTAWYSGRDVLSGKIHLSNFDYIKIGHYDERMGPLNKSTTNQRLFRVKDGQLEDITSKFWCKNDN